MVKNYFLLFFSLFICEAALAQKSKQAPIQNPNLQTKPVPVIYIDRTKLVKKDSLYYTSKGDSLFTGTCVEHWPNNNVKTVYTYKNGKLDGGVARYDEKGRVTAEESYKNGKPSGVWRKF